MGLGEELVYKFDWMFIPVAKLVIDIDERKIVNNFENQNISFEIKTEGALAIIRNYKTLIKKYYVTEEDWNYHLIGTDRGLPEEKFISFYSQKKPIIHKFIDDKGEMPLELIGTDNSRLIDPTSVLTETIQKLKKYSKCDGSYQIYDGKRRYSVKVTEDKIKNKSSDRKIFFNCRFEIDKEIQNGQADNKLSKWPFNDDILIVYIKFINHSNYMPIEFKFSSPIGNIRGEISNYEYD